MCNIVALKAGVSLPYDKFENMTYNNPHGFGLILKDTKNKKIELIRKCHKDGNDPKEIYELLEDNIDLERYLHVRWRTDGPIDIDNTHPFTAYYSDKRQVYFMHNGVLNDFKPRPKSVSHVGGQRIEEPGEDVSDSKKFNDEFLSKFLLRLQGEHGSADITDPFFQQIVSKYWTGGSRGLLVCNDLDPVFINMKEWKELDLGRGKFMSANDTYFNNLSRGPVFEERKKAKEKEDAEKRSRFPQTSEVRRGHNGGIITDLKDVVIKPKPFIPENLSNTFEDYNIWSEEGMASLSQITEVDFAAFVEKSPEQAVALLVVLTSYYKDLLAKCDKMRNHLKNKNVKEEDIGDV